MNSITARFQERKRQTRLLLEKDPILHNLCTTLKERFSAKLLYLQIGDNIMGTEVDLGVPVGYYDMPKGKGRKR